MKKKFLTAMLVLCIVCILIFSVACDNNDDATIPVESIVLEKTEITLENGEEYELKFTVTPANGTLEFSFSEDLLEYSVVSDGVVKLKTLGSGSGKFRISAKSDSSIYAECNINVPLPQGYSQYSNKSYGLKFAYPSNWQKVSVQNTTVAYLNPIDNSSNMNLIVENKSDLFFTVTADYYKNLLLNMYKTLGYTVKFTKCEMIKYDNDTAVRIIMDYSLVTPFGTSIIHQEQFIKNSSSKTCTLTLTFTNTGIDNDLVNTILTEFVTW
ncbi:MAG: photosystem II reaction center PsbP family protein [Clostridia bacterium]|nr:photosystem II reaction center PsbP family protein [Clostridia bacterium]